MSLIDDDNNIALALGGVAVATDDPELLSDNNLNKNAAGTNQESDRSNAAGDDQAVGTRAQADTEDSASGDGNFIENDHNKVAVESFNKEVKVGDITVDKSEDNDKTIGNISFDKSKDDIFGNGDQSTADGVVKYNDQANGEGDLRTADGDIKYNDQANGEGDLRTADGDVKYNDLNDGGGDFSTADGDVKDNGDNRDNGSQRDFEELIDFDDANWGGNNGAQSANASQIYVEAGGFGMNVNQVTNINSENTVTSSYGGWDQTVYADGGDGGDSKSEGGDGGNWNGNGLGNLALGLDLGGGGGGGGYDACEAKKCADDCERDDKKVKCPDPCCDTGDHFADNDGNGGGGGQTGTGGAGGAGGYGFSMSFGGNTATSGGHDGTSTAEEGSSAGNHTTSSVGNSGDLWTHNVNVGANFVDNSFSILLGDA